MNPLPTTAATAAAVALAGYPHDDDADRPCPGRHPVAAIPTGQPIWCLMCDRSIAHALRAPAGAPGVLGIADLVAKVASRRDGQLLTLAPLAARRGPGRTARSTSPGFDEVDDHARWATQWATAIATDLGKPPSVDPTGVDALRMPDLVHALTWLHAHLRPALVGPRAHEFGEQVLSTHRRLQRMAGEHHTRRRLRLPCPACDALALYREDGADLVQCTACAVTWTEPDFQTALATTAS